MESNMADLTVTSPEIYDVDPSGDIILIVGPSDNEMRIQVSSKVLMLASPVLNAMLRSVLSAIEYYQRWRSKPSLLKSHAEHFNL